MKDGKDYINIYSNGKTNLGRWLSNFTYAPFTCEEGSFNSIEGYWYWLGCKDHRLTKAFGFPAKQIGRSVARTINLPEDEFRLKILKAIELKIEANPGMKKAFIQCTLPFKHYYMYGDKVVGPKGLEWLIEGVEVIHNMLGCIERK